MPSPIRGAWWNRPGWSEYKAARGGGGKHWGYDSYCRPRTPIYAIGTGVVVAKGWAPAGFGHYVDVFYAGLNVRQREAHMNEASPLREGARVTTSTALGRVGRTGNAKNIYWIRNGVELWHVHSQAWRGNNTNGDNNVDPRNYWGGTAGNTIDIITPEAESETDMSDIRYLYTKDDGKKRVAYAIVGDEVPGGSRVTNSVTTAEVWGAAWGKPDGSPWRELSKAQWPRMLAEAKVINAAWVAQQKHIAAAGGSFDYAKLAAALRTATTSVDTKPILDAITGIPAAVVNSIRGIWSK